LQVGDLLSPGNVLVSVRIEQGTACGSDC